MRNTLKNLPHVVVFLWLILAFALTACGQKTLQPATGEHAVLEQLATAYRKISQQYPVQPQAMPPEGRKKFVTQVFVQAGFDYSLSLTNLANTIKDDTQQDQRDLAELLLLPTKGVPDKVLEKVYSADELAAVKKLQATFR